MPAFRKVCEHCGDQFEAKRANARFCRPAHRQAAAHRRSTGLPENVVQIGVAPDPPAEEYGPVYAAALEELRAAERAETTLGRAALALAARIDQQVDTGSGLAAAVKQLEATLAAATKGARRAETHLDRVRAARDSKRGA